MSTGSLDSWFRLADEVQRHSEPHSKIDQSTATCVELLVVRVQHWAMGKFAPGVGPQTLSQLTTILWRTRFGCWRLLRMAQRSSFCLGLTEQSYAYQSRCTFPLHKWKLLSGALRSSIEDHPSPQVSGRFHHCFMMGFFVLPNTLAGFFDVFPSLLFSGPVFLGGCGLFSGGLRVYGYSSSRTSPIGSP